MLKSINPKPSMPSLQPTEDLDIIYPLIQNVVKEIKVNVVLDELAGLSYITEQNRVPL